MRILSAGILFFASSCICLAGVPTDDVVTAALWHMDMTIDGGLVTPDDDINNQGRNRELLLTYPGTNPEPPTLTAGQAGNALLFGGTQIARCDNFWNSSYTEFKLEHWLYLSSLASEVGALETYLFTSSVFETDMWPNGGQDYMRFKLIMSSGEVTANIPVYDLKGQWLYVVCSYDANRNFYFSITPESGQTRAVAKIGTAGLKAATCGLRFGYIPGEPPERGFRGMIDEVKISNQMVVPHYSYNPFPANGSTVNQPPAGLQWSKGIAAESSDIYFGSNAAAVTGAVKHAGDIDGNKLVNLQDLGLMTESWMNGPVYPCGDLDFSGLVEMTDFAVLSKDWLAAAVPYYAGSTPGTTMSLPALQAATTYYWRVASTNCTETDPGSVWQFTTGPAQASAPSPVNNEMQTATTNSRVTLGWTEGFGGTMFDVYFGTAANPAFYATVTQKSVLSPVLLPGTNYTWRVDSRGPDGTATGAIWTFTTAAVGVLNPTPAHLATGVKYFLGGAELSWESDFQPSYYNVYFGVQNPPPYAGQAIGKTFLTQAVTSNKKYYWRVDCVTTAGTVTGPVWEFTTATPAFPSAEGFGQFARGGRGGSVYHVTNLNNSGAGSFRDAVSVSGRTIVFDVGGQIVLTTRLGITKNNLTIAGQTAPGDGISIAGLGISVGADDLILRYLRVRFTGTNQDDALSLNDTCDNVIVDHVSASWGTDEVFSITSSRNVTAQWCLITEGQNLLGHSKGSLLEWPQLTMHHCLYAHNKDRNPKSKGVFDYRNNVVFNWGFAPYIAGDSAGFSYANCIGNYYIAGADTTTGAGIMIVRGNTNYSLYLGPNLIDSNRNGIADGVDLGTAAIEPGRPVTLMGVPYAYPAVSTDTPQTAYTRVLNSAGCSRVRDSIDTRVINGVISQTGRVITSYTDVGGLGTISGGTAPLDTDLDGMPDDWETAQGLNKTNANDRNSDLDSDGYTNLEEYLNELAGMP